MELLAPGPPRDDEPGILENAQVLHGAEAGHLQLGLELRERAAVALEEPIEEEAPSRVGESLEDRVVVHARIIRDQMVTCQGRAQAVMTKQASCDEGAT